MTNKNYENKYNTSATTFKVLGWFIFLAGLVCSIIAFADFFSNIGSFEMPKKFYLFFIGFPAMAIGGIFLSFGYKRKVADYNASQVAPVAKDFTNYMLNETGDAIANVASKVVGASDNNVEGVTVNTCAKCGTKNSADAKFCSNCGSPLTKACPFCGAENDDGADYCNSCGKKM